ncbi:MAG: ribulose-phosphate 3-epimerase [[Bacteroides] pectinophilus]|mgnify:FL=1|jgi:ribulose-phosphate 3-epimerase|uniref:Ribulose-phosphate 3-epimerase n=1 Tax=Bacteroides pectinophilus CAG:437 TaxID=1263051 RepID=R7A734_9FIRM|nr:ribulose-phosphate 3-epimerase [[Bacteroides] pectinophilus]CDD56593.1 ribulose-phosphate 3-epimerase [Bacteroides pectinophilus CAG:437]
MNILAPSILSADFNVLGEQIQTVAKAGAQYIHVDVMDGIFVPSISYGMPVIKSVRKSTDAVFDVHLMITEPVRYIRDFVDSGADIITVHVEACKDIDETIRDIKACGVRAAVAINPETPVDKIMPYLDDIDMALVMSVHPGFGGQKFIPDVLDKVRIIRSYYRDNNMDKDIEIDGGINFDNLPEVLEAGANVIVAGSSVYRGDAAANTKKFLELMR